MQQPVFRCLVWTLVFLLARGSRAAGDPPVILFFDRSGNDGIEPADAGEILLGELGCVACHLPDGVPEGRIVVKRAPRLDDVGSRQDPTFLLRHLVAGPRGGSTMPALLTGRAADAVAIAEFLVTRKRPKGDEERPASTSGPLDRGTLSGGEELYHRVGCVACHGPLKTEEKRQGPLGPERIGLGPPSIPLGGLRYKYRGNELARFLRSPLSVRPSGRMPRLGLTREESLQLQEYLHQRRGGVPSRGWSPRGGDEVARGERLYHTVGCARCHGELSAGQLDSPRRSSHRLPKPLLELGPLVDRGCLAETTAPGVPRYGLSAELREAVRAALRRLPEVTELRPAERVERTMARMSCLACHSRGGRGGPAESLRPFFRSVGDIDMGNEGRFPPRLDEVGRKLKPRWLRSVLSGGGQVRPYLWTRMPDFGVDNVGHLVEDLARVDRAAGEKRHEVIGRNRYGRRLVGMDGLRCIECHDLAGHKSLGIRAMDLATTGERLEPEWFREYLLDPASKTPGTRMPAMWPAGDSLFKKILGGNTSSQLDAVYVYLTESRQTRPPVGMEKKRAYVLAPSTRPVLLRTFMKGVGARAIAVGYPRGVHAAFDAGSARLALLWRGDFIDAEGTWDDRFAPFAEPLSDDRRELPGGLALARLETAESPWPGPAGKAARARYRGSRVERDGTPLFQWSFGDVTVEERIEPGGTEGWLDPAPRRGVFRRRLDLVGEHRSLWFRVAVGASIEPREKGEFTTKSGLRVRLAAPDAARAIVRRSSEESELILPVRFVEGKAGVEVEITW